jgi:hypothetical protein
MNECYVNVCGGIGNQLFQVANGYAYSKTYSKELFIDASRWTASQGRHAMDYRDSIFKNFKYGIPTDNTTPIVEQRFNYDELGFYDGSVSLHGYFQSLKYFKDWKDEYINRLYLPQVNTKFITDKHVAFHIRRGDYLNLSHIFDVCNTEYFNKLFIKYKNYVIHVFTDSIDYVCDEFKQHKFDIITTNSEIEDMMVMSKYNTIICSNSTFSWWASILGDIPKKTIIVPPKWLLDRDCSDIYREDMIINYEKP